MSILNDRFSPADGDVGRRYPVVLRFASMFPEALARYQMHAERRGGDLSHVDPERTAQNRLLIGEADWRKLLLQKIDEARLTNLVEELEALKCLKRIKKRDLRMLEGASMPWKASSQGPLREVILTAHRDWFAEESDMERILGESRAQRFEKHAVAWLKDRFGEAVVHARADHDETAYHIHAIVAPWVEKTSARRGTQRLLQPSSIPILADYEKAQDDVGEHFARIGLVRGQKTKAAVREIIAEIAEREEQRSDLDNTGQPVPPDLSKAADPRIPAMRKHVPTPVWWAEEKNRLREQDAKLKDAAKRVQKAEAEARKREASAVEREQEAKAVVDVAEGYIERSELPVALPAGGLGARLVDALRKLGRRMEHDAEAQARQKLAAEFDRAEAFYTRVMALKKRVFENLPLQLRARFARETDAKQKAADDANERLRGQEPQERE